MSFDLPFINEDLGSFAEEPDVSQSDYPVAISIELSSSAPFTDQQLQAAPGFRSYPATATTMPSRALVPGPAGRHDSPQAAEESEDNYVPATFNKPYATFGDQYPTNFNYQQFRPVPGPQSYQASMTAMHSHTLAQVPSSRCTVQRPKKSASPGQVPGDRRPAQRVTKLPLPASAPAGRRRRQAKEPLPRDTKGRTLMRWNMGHDQNLALAMQYEIHKQGVDFDWDAVGKHFEGTKPSVEAINQHLIKVRGWRAQKGQSVPPRIIKQRARGNNRPEIGDVEATSTGKIKREPVSDGEDGYEDDEDDEIAVNAPLAKRFKMGDGYREEDLTAAVYERGNAVTEDKKAKTFKPMAEEMAKIKKPTIRKPVKKEAATSSNVHPRQGQKSLPGVPEQETNYEDIGILPLAPQPFDSQAAQYPGMALSQDYVTSETEFSGFPQYDPFAEFPPALNGMFDFAGF